MVPKGVLRVPYRNRIASPQGSRVPKQIVPITRVASALDRKKIVQKPSIPLVPWW